jgi:alpha-tubulin suppressor-like RCC1 family protein
VSRRNVTPLLLVGLAACQEPGAPSAADPVPSAAESATATTWRQVSPGGGHTCGLTADSLAYCWGWNFSGELGSGTTTLTELRPLAVQSGQRWRDIQPGDAHTCAINAAGRLFCWGDNVYGQVGDGVFSINRPSPTAVATELTFVQVSTGFLYSCAVTASGSAYCWGFNDRGQLGDGSRTSSRIPVKVLGNLSFRHVRAGWNHTCGITTSDMAYCWGRNLDGQLGDGTELSRPRPRAVGGGRKFRMIRTGERHTCALTPAGKAFCWGLNAQGQVGDGTSVQERHLPVAVVNGSDFTTLATGVYFTCGVRKDGAAWCWGYNGYGQLGGGTDEYTRAVPGPVSGNLVWQRVNIGATGSHACGITTAGTPYCWGDNFVGQVGDSTTDQRSVPTPVQGW